MLSTCYKLSTVCSEPIVQYTSYNVYEMVCPAVNEKLIPCLQFAGDCGKALSVYKVRDVI